MSDSKKQGKIEDSGYPMNDRQFLRLIARRFPDSADAGVRKRIFEIADKVSDYSLKETKMKDSGNE